jgi:hypothetical protein
MMTKIQKTTIALIIVYTVWETSVQYWAKDETTAVIRVDLIIIYPILLVLILISIWQYFRK